jgi:hypothetical protein
MGTGNQGTRTRNQPLRRHEQGNYSTRGTALHRIPRLASKPTEAISSATAEGTAVVASSQGFRSSKTIDLWCLAVCSCALTLLCHSLTSAPQTSATYSSQTSSQTSSPISTATSSFNLFTLTSSKPEIKEEEAS